MRSTRDQSDLLRRRSTSNKGLDRQQEATCSRGISRAITSRVVRLPWRPKAFVDEPVLFAATARGLAGNNGAGTAERRPKVFCTTSGVTPITWQARRRNPWRRSTCLLSAKSELPAPPTSGIDHQLDRLTLGVHAGRTDHGVDDQTLRLTVVREVWPK